MAIFKVKLAWSEGTRVQNRTPGGGGDGAMGRHPVAQGIPPGGKKKPGSLRLDLGFYASFRVPAGSSPEAGNPPGPPPPGGGTSQHLIFASTFLHLAGWTSGVFKKFVAWGRNIPKKQ